MKIISTFILMLFMAKGCSSSDLKKESKNITIEYSANTRGNYLKRILNHETFSATKTRDGLMKSKPAPTEEWNQVITLLSKIDLKKLNDFKAPSEKRFYDGAMMANLKIIYNDSIYESTTFDHGNPPEEIKDLVFEILKVSNPDKN